MRYPCGGTVLRCVGRQRGGARNLTAALFTMRATENRAHAQVRATRRGGRDGTRYTGNLSKPDGVHNTDADPDAEKRLAQTRAQHSERYLECQCFATKCNDAGLLLRVAYHAQETQRESQDASEQGEPQKRGSMRKVRRRMRCGFYLLSRMRLMRPFRVMLPTQAIRLPFEQNIKVQLQSIILLLHTEPSSVSTDRRDKQKRRT